VFVQNMTCELPDEVDEVELVEEVDEVEPVDAPP
jgi:hypothetical protein